MSWAQEGPQQSTRAQVAMAALALRQARPSMHRGPSDIGLTRFKWEAVEIDIIRLLCLQNEYLLPKLVIGRPIDGAKVMCFDVLTQRNKNICY